MNPMQIEKTYTFEISSFQDLGNGFNEFCELHPNELIVDVSARLSRRYEDDSNFVSVVVKTVCGVEVDDLFPKR